jgi:hypothetical protein
MEGILWVPFYLEAISLGIFTDLAQPVRLLPFSMDAASVYKEKDP